MKTWSLALLLLAGVAFVFTGCSESSLPPVSPADQTAAPLQKAVITNFTFNHFPIAPPFSGETKQVGEVWIMKDVGIRERIVCSDPLVSGIMIHYLSATMNATTGEGPVHGKCTVTPLADVEGGVWEGTYEGYRSKGPGTYFTLPLKVVVHGKGGTIDGMQGFFESTITAVGTPPTGWSGVGEGFYKSH